MEKRVSDAVEILKIKGYPKCPICESEMYLFPFGEWDDEFAWACQCHPYFLSEISKRGKS